MLLVEDSARLRRAVAEALRSHGFTVITAGTASEALRLAAPATPLALIDLNLPDRTGVELIQILAQRVRSCACVAFTISDDAATVLATLQAGARGFLVKSAATTELVSALAAVAAGGVILSPSIARFVVDAAVQPAKTAAMAIALTPRERELLILLASGLTYSGCAQSLGIAVGTVQSHIKHIYEKLQVSTKVEATVAATRMGLVS